jgi:TonB-linked SusC/RagA family outer membrane protein
MISKMRKLVLATLLLSGLTIHYAFAQSPVKGVVKSANDNRPLESATIVVKGSNSGTQSNAQGQFSISAKAGDQLVISSVGYDTKTVSVLNSSTPLEILLAAAKSDLEDVVVVGYGTQKKVSMTSAVSQIKGADLVRRPVSNLQQALQGQAPGLTVLDRGGEPGRSAATMRIRGITTFSGNSSGNSSPLIIIDGVEQTLFNINPEDVENISILKDASSTAIYGSRAANGVVLVTTKRAKAGKVQIAYNGFYAIQQSVNQAQNMDLEPYMRYQQLAYINQGLAIPARYTDASIQTWVNSKDRYTYPLVNTWFESVLNPAPQQSHNFSFSGGSEFSRTRVSMRYMDQAGIAANHGAKIRELRMSNDMQLSKKLKFSTDLNYRYNLSNRPFAGDVFNRFFHGTLFAAPKYPNGTYGLSPQGFNPLLLTEKSGYNNIATHYIFTSGKLDYEILPDLVFSAQAAAVIDYSETKSFQNQVYNFDSINNRTYSVANNNLTESRNRSTEITTNFLLNYSKKIKKHEMKGLLGYSELYNQGQSLSAYRERFYNNDIQSIGQGANDATKNNSGSDYKYGLQSAFLRLNYAFDTKYLLEANARYDGSSRFTGNNQYSFFPSFSGAWRISKEEFFENLNTPFTDLKVRGSWGQTGNQTVPLYSYYASLSQGSYTFGGAAVQTFAQTALADPNITWETNTQTDLGVEGQLFGNKVNFSIDYYKKRTDGILLALPLPVVTGFASSTQNAGVMDNKGWEFMLGYRNNDHKLQYSFNGNLAINKNEVIDLKGAGPFINSSYDLDPRYIVKVGLPFNAHWGYKTDGYFQNAADIANYPTIATNTKPGDVRYVDLNKDGKINADDWTMIGNPFPKFTFGMTSELNYGAFTLNVFFQGAAEVDTRLSGALSEIGIYEGFTHKLVTDNYWTPERPNALFPLPRKSDDRNVRTNDRLIIDGSYVRLKNLQLVYSVPSTFAKRLGLSNARVYVSGTNLLTFSKMNDWNLDPEAESGRAIYYPQTSLYTFGLNLNF